jgi:hypothetical protein
MPDLGLGRDLPGIRSWFSTINCLARMRAGVNRKHLHGHFSQARLGASLIIFNLFANP